MTSLEEHLINATGPDQKKREEGVGIIANLRLRKGYPVELLKIISNESKPNEIKLIAAIELKNFVTKEWKPNARPSGVHPEDAKLVKENILSLMCASPVGSIQNTLSAVVCVIGEYDFYKEWPNLVSDMVEKLQTNDFNTIQGILKTADSIFGKYRDDYDDDLVDEIAHVLKFWVKPMLDLFERILQAIPNAGTDKVLITKLFECIELISEIYYSLTNLVLPEFFEDHLKVFMEGFCNILAYRNEFLESTSEDTEDLLSHVKYSILQSINMFVQKYSEEIGPFVKSLLDVVWKIAIETPPLLKYNNLLSRTIEFFTMIAGAHKHSAFFNDENVLKSVCEKIIIPNISFTNLDEENFNYDAVEYIRQDIEGSDVETRRRSVYELIKEIRINYEERITNVLQISIKNLLASNNWKDIDTAFFLISALGVKSSTRKKGVQHVNPLVDITSFYFNTVLPQLSGTSAIDHPILKADAIKFITVFRNQLPKQVFLELLPNLIHFLGSDMQVIHTYAAWCIERFLSLRNDKTNRYKASDIEKVAQPLFAALFQTLTFEDSKENEYVMKCIMRVASILKEGMSKFIQDYLSTLARILETECKNPINPLFNHYLFEAFATVIRYNGHLHNELEGYLFPIFHEILVQYIIDFTPYVFQLMALLLDNQNAVPLPGHYQQIFPNLLNEKLWENSGNIPGLVRLLQSYAQKAPNYFTSEILMKYLNVYSNLIRNSRLDHEGFRMINALIEFLPKSCWEEHITQILRIMLTRLQGHKTHKFIRMIIIFFSIYSIKHGIEELVSKIESVQSGIFNGLAGIWLGDVNEVHGADQRKLCSAALTLAACQSKVVIQSDLWVRFVETNIMLLESESKSGTVSGAISSGESDEYTVKFNHLQYATIEEMPLLKLIPEPKLFFAQSLNETLRNPEIRTIIAQKFQLLNDNVKNYIVNYFRMANLNLNLA